MAGDYLKQFSSKEKTVQSGIGGGNDGRCFVFVMRHWARCYYLQPKKNVDKDKFVCFTAKSKVVHTIFHLKHTISWIFALFRPCFVSITLVFGEKVINSRTSFSCRLKQFFAREKKHLTNLLRSTNMRHLSFFLSGGTCFKEIAKKIQYAYFLCRK